MRGRSSTRQPAPRPLRTARAALPALLIALAALAGCRPEPTELRDARSKVREFIGALHARDESRLRSLATCMVETSALRDARLRYLEPPRSIRRAALDSLATRYADAGRIADSLYTAAPDSAADLEARFDRARSLAQRVSATRAAIRATERSAASAPAPATGSGVSPASAELRTIRAHVQVRYAGERAGPEPIDRDTIVRLLRSPGGAWVVYAFDLASDAPGPLPF